MSEERYSKPFANAETFFESHNKGFWNNHLGEDQRRLLRKFETKEVRGDGVCLFRAVGELVNQLYGQIIERVKKAIPRLNITGTFAPFLQLSNGCVCTGLPCTLGKRRFFYIDSQPDAVVCGNSKAAHCCGTLAELVRQNLQAKVEALIAVHHAPAS